MRADCRSATRAHAARGSPSKPTGSRDLCTGCSRSRRPSLKDARLAGGGLIASDPPRAWEGHAPIVRERLGGARAPTPLTPEVIGRCDGATLVAYHPECFRVISHPPLDRLIAGRRYASAASSRSSSSTW